MMKRHAALSQKIECKELLISLWIMFVQNCRKTLRLSRGYWIKKPLINHGCWITTIVKTCRTHCLQLGLGLVCLLLWPLHSNGAWKPSTLTIRQASKKVTHAGTDAEEKCYTTKIAIHFSTICQKLNVSIHIITPTVQMYKCTLRRGVFIETPLVNTVNMITFEGSNCITVICVRGAGRLAGLSPLDRYRLAISLCF